MAGTSDAYGYRKHIPIFLPELFDFGSNAGFTFFDFFVPEIDYDTRRHENEVENVESKSNPFQPVETPLLDQGENLAQNSSDVAEINESHEQQARSFRRAGFIGFDDVKGPGSPETDDHDDLADRRQSR